MLKQLNIILILILCSLVSSCSKVRSNYSLPTKTPAGKHSIYLDKEKVEILYYGDYLFHPYKSSQLPNYHKEYDKLVHPNLKPIIIFCAHTTIKPYCSTLGIWYNKVHRDTLADSVVRKLKSSGNAENTQKEIRLIGKVYNSIITYDLYNSKHKRFIHYTDYISEHGADVFRITFSTTDSNLEWFQNECEGIISTMAFR